MPSLCGTKVSTAAASAPMDVDTFEVGSSSPLSSVLQILDKKVRNLEKRKGKLDGYRADAEKGKQLIPDQKIAIAKYDEVIQTLEFARELSTQFRSLACDEDRNRKKQMKKDSIERSKTEISKVSFILETKDILTRLEDETTKKRLLSGSINGFKLTEQEVSSLAQFSSLIEATKGVEDNDANDNDEELEEGGDVERRKSAFTSASEHFLSLFDGKKKSVAGSTYKDIKAVLNRVRDSRFFDSGKKTEHEESSTEEPLTSEEDDEAVNPSTETASNSLPVVSSSSSSSSSTTTTTTVVEPQQQQQQQQQPASNNNFEFMQESQIDPISMDPAVVVVHHSSPPHLTQGSAIPTQTFTNQLYIAPVTSSLHQHQVAAFGVNTMAPFPTTVISQQQGNIIQHQHTKKQSQQKVEGKVTDTTKSSDHQQQQQQPGYANVTTAGNAGFRAMPPVQSEEESGRKTSQSPPPITEWNAECAEGGEDTSKEATMTSVHRRSGRGNGSRGGFRGGRKEYYSEGRGRGRGGRDGEGGYRGGRGGYRGNRGDRRGASGGGSDRVTGITRGARRGTYRNERLNGHQHHHHQQQQQSKD